MFAARTRESVFRIVFVNLFITVLVCGVDTELHIWSFAMLFELILEFFSTPETKNYKISQTTGCVTLYKCVLVVSITHQQLL